MCYYCKINLAAQLTLFLVHANSIIHSYDRILLFISRHLSLYMLNGTIYLLLHHTHKNPSNNLHVMNFVAINISNI